MNDEEMKNINKELKNRLNSAETVILRNLRSCILYYRSIGMTRNRLRDMVSDYWSEAVKWKTQ